jgi:hypothetical protein
MSEPQEEFWIVTLVELHQVHYRVRATSKDEAIKKAEEGRGGYPLDDLMYGTLKDEATAEKEE